MFHVISAAWARLGRRMSDRQALPFEYAAWHGWEVRQVNRRTYAFRNPRFGRLAAARTAPAAPVTRTWAQAATTARIRVLDPGTDARDVGRGA
jgi:hypothetical protein